MTSTNGSTGLFTGTSGWSYQHWSGVFYPGDLKPARYLEYYCTKFGCVELNSSFYHLPRESTVKGWTQRTPVSFKFCPKLSRFITHQKRLADSEESLQRFFNVIKGMKDRLGPVLVQLPPGLSFDRQLITCFLDLLKTRYREYRFAIEVRHKSWITDGFFELLSQYGIAFVIADSGNRFPCHEAVTTDFVYMRFHGPESLYASDYSDHDLARYAEKIAGWISRDLEAWVFFNNDFNGYAINNASRIIEMIRGKKVREEK